VGIVKAGLDIRRNGDRPAAHDPLFQLPCQWRFAALLAGSDHASRVAARVRHKKYMPRTAIGSEYTMPGVTGPMVRAWPVFGSRNISENERNTAYPSRKAPVTLPGYFKAP